MCGLSTKVGRLLVPDPGGAGRLDDEGFAVPVTLRRVWDFSADGVRGSVESSLDRLGLDRVDVVHLHDPDDHWEQAAGEALPGVDVLAAGLFNSGLPARQEVPDDVTYEYRTAPADLVGRARRIAAVCARHGTTLPAAALWFPFGHPAVTGALIGARTEAELRANVTAFAEPPPAELWAELREEGLLEAGVPTP